MLILHKEIIEKAARKVLRLEDNEHDAFVENLRNEKESPRDNSRWRIATEAARVALDLAEEAHNSPDVCP